MNKRIFFLVSLFITTIDIMATELNIKGYIRGGFQNQETNIQEVNEFAVGGKINIDYFSAYGVGAGFSLYSTNRLNSQNIGMNISYTILGEAYLKSTILNTNIKIGRQEIDTPYLNTDDIAMIPNTFEGVTAVSEDFQDTKITLAYIYKFFSTWNIIPKKIEKINKNDGIEIFGIEYDGLENISLQAWYYNMNKLAKVSYFEANYNFEMANFDITISGQYSNQDFDVGKNSKIYGLSLETIYNNLTFSLAYNKTDGVLADNFWGGGPFFTSTERMTLSEAENNGEATLIGVNWNLKNFNLKEFTLGLSYLNLQRKVDKDINEFDVSIFYRSDSPLEFQFIYSNVDDRTYSERSFNNGRVFINYNF